MTKDQAATAAQEWVPTTAFVCYRVWTPNGIKPARYIEAIGARAAVAEFWNVVESDVQLLSTNFVADSYLVTNRPITSAERAEAVEQPCLDCGSVLRHQHTQPLVACIKCGLIQHAQ